jgi:hypothetical protein
MIWTLQIKTIVLWRGTLGVRATRWDGRPVMRADEKNLVAHAGVVLPRETADRVGLSRALTAALPQGGGTGRRERGTALVQPACAIALGATNVLGPRSSSTTGGSCSRILSRTAPRGARWRRSTLRTRHQVQSAPVPRSGAWCGRCRPVRPGGFPWISVCGREPAGWPVLDLDATIVTCTSTKDGAAGTSKGSFGPSSAGGVGGQHPRVRRDAPAAGQRPRQRRRRPQGCPGEWALEADIEACFDELSHTALRDRIRGRIADKRVLALVKAFLEAGVMRTNGSEERSVTGTPQGGNATDVTLISLGLYGRAGRRGGRSVAGHAVRPWPSGRLRR